MGTLSTKDQTRPRNVGEEFRKETERNARAARRRLGDRVLLFAVIIILWEGVVDFGLVHKLFISSPSAIAYDIYVLFSSGVIFKHFGITMAEALLGLAFGTIVGVGVGFIAALSDRVADALQPFIVGFNSMPRVALAPLFIIWFGFGIGSKVSLAALVVFFAMFFNTFHGMRSVDVALINNVRVMGASKTKTLWIVSLPFTMAWIFAGLNTAISQALVGAVVGEFTGSLAGIGWMMVQASGTLNTSRMFSVLMILAAVGSTLFMVLGALERHVLRWRPKNEM